MDFFSIIIDRVNTTNVFNIIQGRLPSRDTHLQTIVDDDLIQEFLSEIERISRISNSMSDEEAAPVPVSVSGDLRRIGETFFLQFFPEQIQERLRNTERGFLFLHVDSRLRNIPWELLHDGNCFLADKFFMGKNISGYWRDINRAERERLRVLIIADPTEDLEWARLEGEGLFETLNAEVSADRLDVQFMSGRRLTKLNLLGALKGMDIIHYSGHLFYSNEQQESGWLLSDNKVLRAREIENAGFSPFLVFSNSCLSSPVVHSNATDAEVAQGARFNDLAGAFLKAGIGNYIGTNWEIKDNSSTYDFAVQFYRAIFEEKSVGEALYEARQRARRSYAQHDLTWANYVLHGNPLTRIYRSAGKRTFDASRTMVTAERVMEYYPLPIAQGYRDFLKGTEDGLSSRECLALLIETFQKTMLTVGSIIFGNYRFLSLKGELPDKIGGGDPRAWVDGIYHCVRNIRSLNLELAASGLLESIALHKEPIEKLLNWSVQFTSGEIDQDSHDTHLVTFQYLFDNLLSDLASLARYRIIYLHRNGEDAVILHGLDAEDYRLVPAEFKETVLLERADRNRGRLCFYNSSRKILFPLEDFMTYDEPRGEIDFPIYRGAKAIS